MPFGGRENALTFIPRLIGEGFRNTQIVNFLREQGLGYRTQNMFADINQIRLENFGASMIPRLEETAAIPERLMRTWEGDTTYPYRAVVKFEYIDPETGQPKESGTTFYFSTQPTQEEVSELWAVRQQNLGYRDEGEIQVTKTVSVQYFRNTAPRGGGE